MILQAYAIYDSKAQAHLQPFFVQNHYIAVRLFTDCVNDPLNPIAKHPEDYTLFHVGEYDDATGELQNLKAHTSYGLAANYKRGDPDESLKKVVP